MFDNLSDRQKNIIIFLLLILSLVVFFGSIISKPKSKETFNESYNYVTDYSRYYTVSNAVSKYYNFINTKNYNAILKILSENYKSNNNINSDNISSFILDYNSLVSFKSRKMCEKNLADGVVSYYVEGQTVSMNKGTILEDKYFNVILDNNNVTFSIEPIDKNEFVGECHD